MGRNRVWGYDAKAELSSLTGLNIITEYTKPVSESFDVCIIGSGAAGSVLAHALSHKGIKVAIIEKGGYFSMDDLKKQQEERELLRLWKHNGVFLTSNYPVTVAQGQCVGGSTMINYGICFRMPDFTFESWHNQHGVDIQKESLDKAYDAIEKQIAVRKITGAGKSHELLEKGCNLLGYSGDWMSKAYIPSEGKQNVLVAFLERARKENLTIFANCKAEKIERDGRKVIKVRALSNKFTITISAKIIIISAGPIASSEILLKNKLSNGSGTVGNGLTLHPSTSVLGQFDEKIDGENGMAMAYYCDEFSARKLGRRGFMIESVFVPPSNLSLVMPSFGRENLEHMKMYDHIAMSGIMVHDQPNGKVGLNWAKEAVMEYVMSKEDQSIMVNGIRKACMIYFKAGAKKVITGHMETTVLESVNDISKITDDSAGLGKLMVASAHPQGGNRMGKDPRTSVVDSNCKSHELSNLYICDASVFPTSLGVNPQLTVMAIAKMTADTIQP